MRSESEGGATEEEEDEEEELESTRGDGAVSASGEAFFDFFFFFFKPAAAESCGTVMFFSVDSEVVALLAFNGPLAGATKSSFVRSARARLWGFVEDMGAEKLEQEHVSSSNKQQGKL